MKNINKTTKTILFASLIAAMILPFSAMDFAEAAKPLDSISDTKLLDRDFDSWKNQYKDAGDFEAKTKSIKLYTSMSDKATGWNKVMIKDQIRLSNFDTKMGKVGASMQTMLANVEQQKQNDKYRPTEAEKKYHEWAATKYTNPTISDASPGLVKKIVDTHNNLANHGNVPIELHLQDESFWIDVNHKSSCNYMSCEESQKTDVVNAVVNHVLPEAFAANPYHTMNGYIYAWSCEGETGGCSWNVSDFGTGALSDSVSNAAQNEHGIGKNAYIYGSDCSSSSSYTHEIDGELVIGFNSWDDSDTWTGTCAAYGSTHQVANSPQATWEFTYTVNSDAW